VDTRARLPQRSAALRLARRPLCSRHDLDPFAARCPRRFPGGLAAAGAVLRRLAGAGAVNAHLHRVHAGLHACRPPGTRKHRTFQRLAMVVVAVLLARHRDLRHHQLAPWRADPGDAPMATASDRSTRLMACTVDPLCRRYRVACAGRNRILVGVDGSRPPDVARPCKRHQAAATLQANPLTDDDNACCQRMACAGVTTQPRCLSRNTELASVDCSLLGAGLGLPILALVAYPLSVGLAIWEAALPTTSSTRRCTCATLPCNACMR